MVKKGTNLVKQHEKNRLELNQELKQVNFLDTRVYKRGKNKYYPSVTTILQYFPKGKFFEQWLKDVGYNADIILKQAGKEGTQTHEAIEKLLLGENITWMDDFGRARYNEKVWGMIGKFVDFWKEFEPILTSTEEFVYSDEHEYAGTADIVCEIDGETWLLDIKTSNSLYRSYDLQLAAYAKAWEEMGKGKIDRTGIIWLKSMKRGPRKGKMQGKGWEVKMIDDIDKNFDLFKTIYKLYSLDNPKIKPIYNKYSLEYSL